MQSRIFAISGCAVSALLMLSGLALAQSADSVENGNTLDQVIHAGDAAPPDTPVPKTGQGTPARSGAVAQPNAAFPATGAPRPVVPVKVISPSSPPAAAPSAPSPFPGMDQPPQTRPMAPAQAPVQAQSAPMPQQPAPNVVKDIQVEAAKRAVQFAKEPSASDLPDVLSPAEAMKAIQDAETEQRVLEAKKKMLKEKLDVLKAEGDVRKQKGDDVAGRMAALPLPIPAAPVDTPKPKIDPAMDVISKFSTLSIAGPADHLVATIRIKNFGEMRVHEGMQLPEGFKVSSVGAGGVFVSKDNGRPIPVPFAQ